MSGFCCPICQKPMKEQEKSYFCPKGHCFDKAKSGYVNLLPSSLMHSKAPGDNKLMVSSRRDFLNRGYYCLLLKQISQIVLHHLNRSDPFVLLDAGCGEGYYTDGIAKELASRPECVQILGIDISKTAVSLAAKKNQQIAFAVGSIFHLPVLNEGVSMLLNIFAPFCLSEFIRVLKPGGILLSVIPGPRHLWQLKQVLYETPYLNESKEYEIKSLTFLEKQAVRDKICLQNKEDIENLFRMTPYFYKTSKEALLRLEALSVLKTEIEFELLVYQKPER